MASFLHQQQTNHWSFYRANRLAFEEEGQEEGQEASEQDSEEALADFDGDVEMEG